MAIKKYKPITPGQRGMTVSAFDEITKTTPEKSLTVTLKKHAGRNVRGKITVRHRGGGYRPKYRIIDFKRRKDGIQVRFPLSNTIRTEAQTSHSSSMRTVKRDTSSHRISSASEMSSFPVLMRISK